MLGSNRVYDGTCAEMQAVLSKCPGKFGAPHELFQQYEICGRDRPLSFHWRAKELADSLSLSAARTVAHETARASVVAEAILGSETDRPVSYSRRKVFYSNGRRYREPAYTYATVMAAIDELAPGGWITDCRVAPGNRGWQSSFQATDALVRRYHESVCGMEYTMGEIILLKNDDGELMDYRDNRETVRMRKNLARINESLAPLRIDVPGAKWRGKHLLIDQSCLLPTPGNAMRRIFSRGSFALHGRAYRWWQSIPKKSRAMLTIDAEATAEVDYSALHAQILYGKTGVKFSGDPYQIEGFDRPEIKLGFNIALNAKNEQAAIRALLEHLETRDRQRAVKIIAAINKRHKPVAMYFCSDAGVRLMRIDSEMILKALSALNRDGHSALPVHDALIMPARYADRAAARMVESFEQLVGSLNRCQIKIKAQTVPHMGDRGDPPLRPNPLVLAHNRTETPLGGRIEP